MPEWSDLMTRRRRGLAVFVLLLPAAAMAEVMDKVSVPWESARVVPMAITAALCAAGAWRSGWTRTLALALAVAWAAANVSGEDLYDPHVGPAIRDELSPHELQAYRVLSPVGALVPLAVVVALAMWRERRRGGRDGAGRRR